MAGVRHPDVFLFDEPLSNLDAKLRVQMRTEIRALHQRLTTTSIYVTHDQIEAMTMADRIVVLRDGGVEQIGSPLDLYDRPGNAFVATFIGSPSMNLLSGEASGTTVRLDAGGELPLPQSVPIAAGQRVTVGFRPEHLRVVGPDAPGAITCRVEVLEFTGADTFLACEKGGKALQIIVHQRLTLRAGDALGLAVDVENLHVFDETSGRRLG